MYCFTLSYYIEHEQLYEQKTSHRDISFCVTILMTKNTLKNDQNIWHCIKNRMPVHGIILSMWYTGSFTRAVCVVRMLDVEKARMQLERVRPTNRSTTR